MRNAVIPEVKKQEGLRRIYLLGQGGSNGAREYVSLSLWDSKENADRYGGSGGPYSGIIDSMRDYFEGEASLREYEVTMHEVNAEDLPPPQSAKDEARREIERESTSRSRSTSRRPSRRSNKGKGSTKSRGSRRAGARRTSRRGRK